MFSLLFAGTHGANGSTICEYSALHTNTYANRPEITKGKKIDTHMKLQETHSGD